VSVEEGHYVPTAQKHYVYPRWVLAVSETHVYYSRHGTEHFFCRVETFREWVKRSKARKEPA
jgi:hypothetical protein